MLQVRRRGSIIRAIACLAMLAGMLAGGMRPAAADVSTVNGRAFGYLTKVGLFGGGQGLQGYGQVACTGSNVPAGCAPSPGISYSPSEELPTDGSGSVAVLSETDTDGAIAQYGPAKLFSGIWPPDAGTAPPSGPITVSTQGTAADNFVTSSVDIGLRFPADPDSPGGIGPSPIIADEAHSTCTATESGVTGSATFVNGILETKFDEISQLPTVTEPMPSDPPPNYTRSGTIDHVGDNWTVVLNEQITTPDSITVNAVHLYLHGPIAIGEMIIGSTTCSVGGSTVPNAAPAANNDTFSATEDTPLTIDAATGLLTNDTEPDGHPVTVSVPAPSFVSPFPPGTGPPLSFSTTGWTWSFPSDPPHGSVTINGDGSFEYIPDADYAGPDSFTYLTRDARGATDSGVVTINVAQVTEPPTATDDSEAVTEDTPYTLPAPGVLGNDHDGDADPLTATATSEPTHGDVVLNADGSFTYTPDLNYQGSDSFTYTVDDGQGGSDNATVNLVVSSNEARILKDVAPGIFGADVTTGYTPFADAVFFTVGDNAFNPEAQGLWKTDGTPGGTVMVKALTTGFAAIPITVAGGTMFFVADTGPNGSELWKSDGTAAGTVMLKDINPGPGDSYPNGLKAMGTNLYFNADDGTNGVELWKSDGTAAGTVLVKDIKPGAGSSTPSGFTMLGSTVLFSADDGATNFELWKTDGTAAGTELVKNIAPGNISANPTWLTAMGGSVFFSATQTASTNGAELWKTDGTTAGTAMVKEINPSTAATGGSRPNNLTVYGSTLVFTATDGGSLPGSGFEMWKSDGTAAGTVMVRDLKLGSASGSPGNYTVVGGVVYFSADNGLTGMELWKTDGTDEGTLPVKDINAGSGASSPAVLTPVGSTVYFRASDGNDGYRAHGHELWRTDGTAAGTVMAKDILPGLDSGFPTGLTPALGTLFFNGYEYDNGNEPWRILPPDTAPVAGDDTYSADRNIPLTVAAPGVLANDSDANLHPLTAGSASDPANGSVTLNADGSFTYTPDPYFVGSDSFSYVVDDGDAYSDTGLVTVNVELPTTLSVGDVSVAEDGTSATFTITRSGRTSGSSTVKYKTSDGTAKVADNDYTAVPVTEVTFDPGQTTKTVTVGVGGDNLPEADETFSLVLSYPSYGTALADASAIATVVNDDGAAFLSVDNPSVTEGSSGTPQVTFTVTRSGNTNGVTTVKYKTTDGTAKVAGNDYTGLAIDTLTFAAAETTKTVAVNVNPDTADEAHETLNLVLSVPWGATLADTSGTATIVDDDGPARLSVADVVVNEGAGNATFTVERSGNTTGASSVKWKTANGTATTPGDYTAVGITDVAFAAGDLSKQVSVPVVDDGVDEKHETFSIALSVPVGAFLTDTSATATIDDNDPGAQISAPPTTFLTVSDPVVTEGNAGNASATFTITRSGDTSGASTAKASTTGGNAASGTDYTPVVAADVIFAATDTTQTVTVDVAGDTAAEVDETFNLVLSAQTGATLTDAAGTATIVNDDASALLSVGDIRVTEGSGGTTAATFTVTRTGNTTGISSAKVAASGGTATSGTDYTALAAGAEVSFGAGESSKDVTVTLAADTLPEKHETFNLVLTAPVGAVLADAAGTATILNDDGSAYLTVENVTVLEGNSGLTAVTFTVTRSGNTDGISTVSYSATGGTASVGSDYTASSGSLTFEAGQSTKQVTVNVNGDITVEPAETFNLVLSTPVGTAISDGSGAAKILNDD